MRSRGSIVVPLVLIAAGVVLILNNLGLVSWDVWTLLARLWPVLLIALGLDLLLGRSVLRWAVAAALVALVGIAVTLALFGPSPVGPGEEVRIALAGARRAELILTAPVGTLEVQASSDPALLVSGTITAPWPDRSRWRADRLGEVIRVDVALERGYELPAVVWPNRTQARLRLSPGIPIALRATLGEGQATLDLSGLLVTDLAVRGGGGRFEVTLPAQGDVTATVWGGSGEATVRVPASVGARIRVAGGCGPVEVVGDYTELDGAFVSRNWGATPHTVDLRVGGGAGRVLVLLGSP